MVMSGSRGDYEYSERKNKAPRPAENTKSLAAILRREYPVIYVIKIYTIIHTN